jgi:5-methylcytosine-specific restriction endonuclease McrA
MRKQRPLRSLILSGLGKAWMYWPPRLAAKARAKHPTKKGWYVCELCKQEREKIEIDHVVPCIRPADGFTTWDDYIKSRFVETADQLQALCHECHLAKSKQENAKRREAKKVTEADLDEFAKRFKGADNVKADVNSERSKQVVRQVRRRVSVRKEARPDKNSGG